jgi:hypothetical protein
MPRRIPEWQHKQAVRNPAKPLQAPEHEGKKAGNMRLVPDACIYCGGDVYIDYKYGRLCKCLKCGRVMLRSRLPRALT